MTLDLTFKKVCETLRQGGEPELINALDRLLGVATIFAPVVGPVAKDALEVLGVKDELIKLGKWVVQKVTQQTQDDYVKRHLQMQMVYGLLCYTAFFEAVDQKMPAQLRKRIKLLPPERVALARQAQEAVTAGSKAEVSRDAGVENARTVLTYSFPHPAETLGEQAERLSPLWVQLSKGFGELAASLAVWEDLQEKEEAQMLAVIVELPKLAAICYEAQYVSLAKEFPEFAIWANLQEHKGTKALIAGLSQMVQTYAELAAGSKGTLDIGFAGLHKAVAGIPESLKISRAGELAADLARHYLGWLDAPITTDREEHPGEGKVPLSIPSVREAFVPQSFQVLRQEAGNRRRLEDEITWCNLPRRDDLAAFLLSYLTSPYSMEALLLILGHPGSGKSLLTKVLAAQLMSDQFTVIWVPLRSVNADSSIVTQIEKGIALAGGNQQESWYHLSSRFKNSPPVVILDGYDELLQASGQAYADYLKQVEQFQQEQARRGQPVRVIVTSRITLIDTATMVKGATIIRLLEFDRRQRNRWTAIWNAANAGYFLEAGVRPFALPDEDASGAEKVLALAEQPLLLLMLALYDSEGNEVQKSESLDRTLLYYRLLWTFVARERRKDPAFRDLPADRKREALDAEMRRLGVVALGMYNRRKLHILSSELEEDLKFFKAERPDIRPSMKAMSQADLLFGSFFFIHRSEADHSVGAFERKNTAFEFLHNTFGEFLTADLLLRHALDEVETLQANLANRRLAAQADHQLYSADGLAKEWFAGLINTPLFSRPVVLEMMREWIGHFLESRRAQVSRAQFVDLLDQLIVAQIGRLLSGRAMASPLRTEAGREAVFGDFPLAGHMAIYSINLILLRSVLGDQPYVFDEERYEAGADGVRPWDRLIHLWRSWFSLEKLHSIAAIISAERVETRVTIRSRERFRIPVSRNRGDLYLNVAAALGDNIAGGLAGVLLYRPTSSANRLTLEAVLSRLNPEGIFVSWEVARKRILEADRLMAEGKRDALTEAVWFVLRHVMDEESEPEPDAELVLLELERVMYRLLRQGGEGADAVKDVFLEFSERITGDDLESHPELVPVLRRIAEMLGDTPFLLKVDRIGAHMLEPGWLLALSEREPRGVLHWLQAVGEQIPHPEWVRYLVDGVDMGQIVELSQRHPEAALAWFDLLHRWGAGQRLVYLCEGLELESVSARSLAELFARRPAGIAAALRVARLARSRKLVLALGELFGSNDGRSEWVAHILGYLPMSAVPDLRWLAGELNDRTLLTELQQKLG